MNFFELINKRHSVRSFKSDPLTKGDIKNLVYAAIRAPSAGNLQAYEIDVVTESQKKEAVAKACVNQMWIAEAPVVFVFYSVPAYSVGKYGMRGQFYAIQDATIAASYLQLAATEMGFGSCWVGAFVDASISTILNAPQTWRVEAVIPVGYSNEVETTLTKREIRYNRWV